MRMELKQHFARGVLIACDEWFPCVMTIYQKITVTLTCPRRYSEPKSPIDLRKRHRRSAAQSAMQKLNHRRSPNAFHPFFRQAGFITKANFFPQVLRKHLSN